MQRRRRERGGMGSVDSIPALGGLKEDFFCLFAECPRSGHSAKFFFHFFLLLLFQKKDFISLSSVKKIHSAKRGFAECFIFCTQQRTKNHFFGKE